MNKLPAVILWAIAFAYVESAIVEYLRALYYPLADGGFLFPVKTLAELEALGPEHLKRLTIELGRELATLIMLASVAAAAGRNRREAWAHFLVGFGVWDIFYYIWLKLFLDWPPGFMTWDLLFLVPAPWVGPVWAPVVLSVVMIAAGVTVLWFESRSRPVRTTWTDWFLITAGGVIVIVSFCWDASQIMTGGTPNPFLWPIFAAGLALSSGVFLLVIRRSVRETASGPS